MLTEAQETSGDGYPQGDDEQRNQHGIVNEKACANGRQSRDHCRDTQATQGDENGTDRAEDAQDNETH
jgi:hypothetical protein